tara:strand:- start:613 stop:864 length:252 start_codon:yes stop_codon:yes gene_type:complete
MSNQQYKNIGKKQIINVVSQLIQKVEAIEMTLNLLIMLLEDKKTIKKEELSEYIKEKLGEHNEPQKDGTDNTKGNTPKNNTNS